MLSDGFPEKEIPIGENIALSVRFNSKEKQEFAFSVLKENGTVTMEFSETSINSRLGTLIDKFGIHWYLNFSL